MSAFNGFGPENDVLKRSMDGIEPSIAWIANACRRDSLAPGKWDRDAHDFPADEGFSEEERELLVRSFLSAGVDTTIKGIGNLLHAFSRHPANGRRCSTRWRISGLQARRCAASTTRCARLPHCRWKWRGPDGQSLMARQAQASPARSLARNQSPDEGNSRSRTLYFSTFSSKRP